jgi:hypothetical protein
MLEISYAGLGEYNLSGVASAVLDLGMRGVNSSRASYLLLAKVSSVGRDIAHRSDHCARASAWHAHLAEELGDTNLGARATNSSVVDAVYTRRVDELS